MMRPHRGQGYGRGYSDDDADQSMGFGQGAGSGPAGHMGRFRSRGIRYWALYLLKDKPMTGAEIMDAMESQSMGWWRPSPGSIYPMLNELVQEGVLNRGEDGRYTITERGFEYIGIRKDKTANIERTLSELEGLISYLQDNKDGLEKYKDRIKRIRDEVGKL